MWNPFQVAVCVVTFVCISTCQASMKCPIKAFKCTNIYASVVTVNCKEVNVDVMELCKLCDKNRNIKRLIMEDVKIPDIPEFCFERCNILEFLSLESNNITRLHRYVFKGLTRLKNLNLNNNSLMVDGKLEDADVFKPLVNLETLQIKQNIKKCHSNHNYLWNVANDSLVNLQTFLLDGIPNAVFGTNFRNFKHLKTIDFSGTKQSCRMYALNNATFENVPYVKRLYLSNCGISTIQAGTFEPLTSLQVLNLSYNRALGFRNFRNVSYGLQFTNIERLDYSSVYKTFGLATKVYRCDVWFLRNTTLKEIWLSKNRIALFETNALALLPESLEHVFLEDNKLSFGPYVLQLGCMENLKTLQLDRQDHAHHIVAYNKEVTIQEDSTVSPGGCIVTTSPSPECHVIAPEQQLMMQDITFPRNLASLSFASSHLRYDRSVLNVSFPIKNSLKSIDVSHNVFFNWSGMLFKFDALRNLNLSNNFCSYVSKDFFINAPNIENLDASFNKLGPHLARDTDGSTFHHLRHLKALNLSNNWITYLSENMFSRIGALELLDLSYNQIDNVDFRYEHMKNLLYLNFLQNKISTIPVALLKKMEQNSMDKMTNITINLSDNILDASCRNKEFLSWMVEHSEYFDNIESYTFLRNGHDRISYQEMVENFTDFLASCHQYTFVIAFAACFIIGFISVIIGGITYRYRWRLRYLYYMTKARYAGYNPIHNMDVRQEYRYDIFISYATENYQFVTRDMYNELEGAGFSLCLHQKDFLPGNDIAENIVQAVRNSRMTLVVLSPAFLESRWCVYEFNMARMESIYSRGGENVLFIVMYEDVDIALVSSEMRECLESESYLKYPEDEEERQYFWRLLIQALGCTRQ